MSVNYLLHVRWYLGNMTTGETLIELKDLKWVIIENVTALYYSEVLFPVPLCFTFMQGMV